MTASTARSLALACVDARQSAVGVGASRRNDVARVANPRNAVLGRGAPHTATSATTADAELGDGDAVHVLRRP
jgi:hypothetical protein